MFTKSRLIMLSDLAENESNIIEELEIDTSKNEIKNITIYKMYKVTSKKWTVYTEYST